jgi:predicted nucleotidyltransferase component of viral defense system
MGATLTAVQTAPTFRRFILAREGKHVVVDLVLETAYQAVPEKPSCQGIRVDAIEDITANKLCTVLSRLELRDYVDLAL